MLRILFLIVMVFGGVIESLADSLTVTGRMVTAGCERTVTQGDFVYDQWAGPCPLYEFKIADFLKHYDIVQDSLPPCQLPENEELGEVIDGNITIPDGYKLVDENISDVVERNYDGYGKISSNSGDPRAAIAGISPSVKGIRTNLNDAHGYCHSLTVRMFFKADVYEGIIRESKFTRVYEKECNLTDRPFPALSSNEKVLFSWGDDDNRSAECVEIGGAVQDSIVDCKSNYRCVKCAVPNIQFPMLADNEVILFSWGGNSNRSTECAEVGGVVQDSLIDCKLNHRCVGKIISCQIEVPEFISSYVNPKDRSFIEDIEIDGVDFMLNYSSKFKTQKQISNDNRFGLDVGFGKGWMPSLYAYFLKVVNNEIILKDASSVSAVATVGGVGGSVQNSSLLGGAILKPREEYYFLMFFGDGKVWRLETFELSNGQYLLDGAKYIFDGDGEGSRLLEIVDIYSGNLIWQFGYDENGLLNRIVDSDGKITTINRDGFEIEIVAPYGQKTTLHLDEDKNLESVSYEDGSSYDFEYEENSSLMVKKIGLRGQESIHTFDKYGKIKEVIDAKGAVWSFENSRDDDVDSKKVIRPLESVEYKHYSLTDDGRLIAVGVLPSGDKIEETLFVKSGKTEIESCQVEKIYEYEKDNFTNSKRVKKVTTTTPSGLKKVIEYRRDYTFKKDILRKIDEEIVQNGKAVPITTDYLRKRVRFWTPLGERNIINFDKNMKHITSIKSSFLNEIKYKYDGDGRLIKIKQGNRTVEYSYDSRGNIASVKDRVGNITSYSYDERDRLISITYPDGTSIGYSYDKDGNMVALTTPTPTKHSFKYDELNIPKEYTSAMQNILNYSYDKQRRLVKVTKPSGKSIEINYRDGRVEKVITDDETVEYDYYCQNLLSKIQKSGEILSFGYDGNLLTNITQNGTVNQTINFTYNNDFLPKSISYGGKKYPINYDDDGRVVRVGDFTIEWDRKTVTVGDFNYFKKIRLNGYGELKRSNDGIFFMKLERNSLGLIKRKTERLNRRKNIYRYSYDLRGRLTKVIKNNQIVEEYTYDANGNRISATIYGKTYQGDYNQDDQIVSYGGNSYVYDEDGYLIEKRTSNSGTIEYQYNSFGELTDVITDEHNITYVYNPMKQRIAKKIDGETVEKYLWLNLTTLLAIYDKNDNLVQRFEYANDRMPVSMTDANGTKYYLHYDQVGSLRAVSNENGDVVKEIVYDTFGNIISDSNETLKVPFGFAGGLYDRDTKLIHFGFREYDPFTGRWTAKDPILFAGGDTNLYGYVLGDPVSGVDALGLCVNEYDKPYKKIAFGVCEKGSANYAINYYFDNIKKPVWLKRMTSDIGKAFSLIIPTFTDNVNLIWTKMIPNGYRAYKKAPVSLQMCVNVSLTILEFGMTKSMPIIIQIPYDLYSGANFNTIPTSIPGWISNQASTPLY